MPTKSPAQHRLMEAVAHDPEVAKKTGIPQSVGKEFVAADADKAHEIFDKHFNKPSAPVPALLMGKSPSEHCADFLAMRDSLIGK